MVLSGKQRRDAEENRGEPSQEVVSEVAWIRAVVCYLHPRVGPALRHLTGGHWLWDPHPLPPCPRK